MSDLVGNPKDKFSHDAANLFLQDLATNDGIYRIRVATKSSGEDEEYVSTFTKAVGSL